MRFTLRPVKGEGFIDREELLDEMVSELRDTESTTGYALYGKRRIGKTSILKEVQRRLSGEHKISNINRFLRYLEEKGYVLRREGGYYVMEDPVFERWLRELIWSPEHGDLDA